MILPGAKEGHLHVFCTLMKSLSWQHWGKDFTQLQIKLMRQICGIPYQQGNPLQYHWQKYLPPTTEPIGIYWPIGTALEAQMKSGKLSDDV